MSLYISISFVLFVFFHIYIHMFVVKSRRIVEAPNCPARPGRRPRTRRPRWTCSALQSAVIQGRSPRSLGFGFGGSNIEVESPSLHGSSLRSGRLIEVRALLGYNPTDRTSWGNSGRSLSQDVTARIARGDSGEEGGAPKFLNPRFYLRHACALQSRTGSSWQDLGYSLAVTVADKAPPRNTHKNKYNPNNKPVARAMSILDV